MPRYIPGIGPSNAKLMVLGEAGGEHEEIQGVPFVGKSGELVDRMLDYAGTSRRNVYVTNVVKYRPPNNDLTRLSEIGIKMEDCIEELWNEIRTLQPNCILALGNTALQAVTGKTGISHYRGSILWSSQGPPKVVPSIHPAAIFQEHGEAMNAWKQVAYIKHDFQRAVQQSQFSERNIPDRTIRILRSSLEVWRYLESIPKYGPLSVDVETYRTIPVCYGFAVNRWEGVSVPMFNLPSKKWPELSMHERTDIWKSIADVLYDMKIRKNGQNFKFDCRISERVGSTFSREPLILPIRSIYFDTMLGFHTLYPEFPKRLEFITSILTEEPYYKHEGKEYNPKKDDPEVLFNYNARDAVVEHECMEEELKELEEYGLTDFFFTQVMPRHDMYYRIESVGFQRDNKRQKELSQYYEERKALLQKELEELLGIEVNANSPQQVSKLLYEQFGISRRKDTREETLLMLLANTVKNPLHRKTIELILEIRKVRKTKSTYVDAPLSDDGRLHTSCNIVGTESGRTSTSLLEPPVTKTKQGLAFQTITKHSDVGTEIKSMFIPDPGFVLLESDSSQAEARVVAVLAKDYDMLKCFEYKIDIHRLTFAWIDSIPIIDVYNKFIQKSGEECQKWASELNYVLKTLIDAEKRQLGKKFRHAGNYWMQKRRAVQVCASEGINISEWRAGKILDKFHETNPKIHGIYHADIVKALSEGSVLVTPWGRRRQFFGRWSDELFKEAYAHYPQSTVADNTKMSMIGTEQRIPFVLMLQEWHDSFVTQWRPEHLPFACEVIKEEMTKPIDFRIGSLPRDYSLVIPCDFKVGLNWQESGKDNPLGMREYDPEKGLDECLSSRLLQTTLQ